MADTGLLTKASLLRAGTKPLLVVKPLCLEAYGDKRNTVVVACLLATELNSNMTGLLKLSACSICSS